MSRRCWLVCAAGVVEEEFNSVHRFDAAHLHTGEVGDACLRPCDGGLLQIFVDVHIDATVLMLAELLLQRGDELAECLLLVARYVRQ
jgi:hypothetical protein